MKTSIVLRNFSRKTWVRITRRLFWLLWAFLVGALVGITLLIPGGR